MSDNSFRRFGGMCAVAMAVVAVAYVALLYLDTNAPGLGDRLQQASQGRTLNQAASLLLALLGVLTTVAVTGLAPRVKEIGRDWARWGTCLGVIGGALTAVHGYWDFARVPVLLEQWGTGDPARQAAITAFSGVQNPVDPRGLGTFLFAGVFVLVASRLAAAGKALPALIARWGVVYGVLLILTFAAGLVDSEQSRLVLTGATMGVAGPVWWIMVGRELLRG